jgi:diacylglycerol kinase (ATP)
MVERLFILVNPQAGGGRGKKVAIAVQRHLQEQNITYRMLMTEYPQHALVLAEDITKQIQPEHDRLLVIGGDGTLHEVITGLMQANAIIPVGYIGAGTGNDFARALGLPKNPIENLKQFLALSHPRELELFSYREVHSQLMGTGINSFGFGFDAAVLALTLNPSSGKKIWNQLGLGKAVYLLAILKAFRHRNSFSADITIDGQIHHFDRLFILAAMNHPFMGGGIKIDPLSKQNSHELGILILHDISIPVILQLLPKVFTDGSHIHSHHFIRYSGQSFDIALDETGHAQVDGELLESKPYNLHFEMVTYPFWIQ